MDKYDVIIIGGGTSGIAAAYIAGKKGLKTLLIEKNIYLGGSITSGLVIPVMKTLDQNLNSEFINDFKIKLKQYNASITFEYNNNDLWINPMLCQIVLDDLLKSVNCEILYDSYLIDVKYNNQKINSVIIFSNLGFNRTDRRLSICNDSKYIDNLKDQKSDKNEILSLYNDKIYNDNTFKKEINSKYFIDATGDGVLSRLANCELIENTDNMNQSVTLRFILTNVNIKKFAIFLESIDKNRDISPICKDEYGHIQLSTAYTTNSKVDWALKPIFEKAIRERVIEKEDSDYFQIFTIANSKNSIAFNAPRINTIVTDVNSETKAIIEGRERIYRLYQFVKKYLPGFEEATISNIANSLGIRYSYGIKGKYIYKKEDMIENKRFNNEILQSDYPIDIHGNKKNSDKLQEITKAYSLCLESIKSYNYDNLYIIGRILSAEFEAQAALRVQKSCFQMGEAAIKDILNIENKS